YRGHAPRGHPAAFAIVGPDIAQTFRSINPGIEDHDRDAYRDRPLHHSRKCGTVDGGECDPADPLVDHRFHDRDLPATIPLLGRSVPQNLVTGFAAGLDRARMHRLPENVGRSLRYYADDTAGAAITAGGGQHEQHT